MAVPENALIVNRFVRARPRMNCVSPVRCGGQRVDPIEDDGNGLGVLRVQKCSLLKEWFFGLPIVLGGRYASFIG